ncbi:MAG TPA: nuclear transport factor 2 family protein, partial [Solirubrobacteraceae bacterium]
PLEVPLGVITRAREGRVERVELFAADDEAGLRARFAELRGGPDAPEHWRRYCDYVNAKDWDGLRTMFAADYTLVDHRELAWEPLTGADDVVAVHRAAEELATITMSVDAVVAADDDAGVNAVRLLARGGSDEAPAETMYSVVTVLRDGLLAHTEFFAPEDEEAMLSRYEQLRAAAQRRPVSPISRRRNEIWAAAASAGHFDDIVESEDYVFVDHRHGGVASMVDPDDPSGLRSVHAAARDLRFASDPFAGLDDGTVDVLANAVTLTGEALHGGGRFEVVFWSVSAARDGSETYRVEMFEVGDPLMLQRFDALCVEAFNGVTLSPHAREPIPSAIVARQRRWAGAFNANDWDAVVAMWDEDVERVDHRRLGWEAVHDREGFALDVTSLAASTDDLRTRIELVAGAVAGERWVFAALIDLVGRSRDSGGETLHRMGWVIAGRGESSTNHEVFDDDDLESMLERYDALRTTIQSGGWLDALAARDWEAARALLHDDMVVVDHRPVGWGTDMGADRVIAATRSLGEASPDTRWRSFLVEQHRDHGRVVERVRLTVEGTTDGAPWEMPFLLVGVIEDGLRTRFEFFDADDEEAAGAAFEALKLPEELFDERREWLRCINERDWDTLRAHFAADAVRVDRRPIGWEEFHGPDESVAQMASLAEASPDMRVEMTPLCGVGDRSRGVTAALYRLSGTQAPGGGAWEVLLGGITVLRDGVIVRAEQLEHDADAVRARFEELRAEVMAGAGAGPR